jgi:hypothetical protein
MFLSPNQDDFAKLQREEHLATVDVKATMYLSVVSKVRNENTVFH